MFGLGIIAKAALGAAALSVATAGVQTYRLSNMALKLERASTAERVALGALDTCANRLTNIQEAAASNASIPDNLSEFNIPDGWLLPDEGPNFPTH